MKKIYRFILISIVLAFLVFIAGDAWAGTAIGGRFLIYDDTGDDEEVPSVAYNSQSKEYLVVWHAESSGVYEVWGRRVSANGAPLSSAFRISPSSQGARPDVTYNSTANEYLVVWEHGVSVYGQRLSSLGVKQGSMLNIVLGTSGVATYTQPAVAYGSTADRYLVAYRYGTSADGSTNILVHSLQSNGTAEVAGLEVGSGTSDTLPEQPDVAYNRSRDEFLVVWQETYFDVVPYDLDIRGRRIEMDGVAGNQGSSFLVIGSLADEFAPAVTAIPTVPDAGQYLITWQKNTSSASDIGARTVSGIGATGPLRTVANTAWGEYRPAVAGCESSQQFLVVWRWVPVVTPPGVMQVQGKTLDIDGVALNSTATFGGGQVYDVAVATGPTCDRLIAFDDNATFGTWGRGIYGLLRGYRVYLPLVLRN